jgi:hypothetical protein
MILSNLTDAQKQGLAYLENCLLSKEIGIFSYIFPDNTHVRTVIFELVKKILDKDASVYITLCGNQLNSDIALALQKASNNRVTVSLSRPTRNDQADYYLLEIGQELMLECLNGKETSSS